MRYLSPLISQIEIGFPSKNQGTGDVIIPLNPDCDGGGCDNTFSGVFCHTVEGGVGYDVHYFLPNSNCESFESAPCVVKVNGNILSCSEEDTCADTTCDTQAGAIVRCSGFIPNLDSCSGLQSTVECTSETDSDDCTFAP